ncbi:methyltransferase, FkbM family [Methylobacterium phyllostachyos]|uniref:Methyltransferase, FkbM family n=1 Tax=Methylobacterium phyllostachyos TaxID=582672 RepID=A0A1G9RA61_9HYPH|nr:FkbM family methyltransferase [Methylobacterium phyllostachyos]SDM19990.1 methyltransferase, FkbM family [Methylobacterium phyllostachyos]
MRAPTKSNGLEVLKERQINFSSILDVGVFVGTPELIEAFPDKRHILFEPVAEFEAEIARNYANVNYRLVRAAVSESSGSTALETTSIVGGDSITHSSIGSGSHGAQRQVDMTSIDDFLDRNDETGPYLLKIDVDGFELQVLAGARRHVQDIPVIVVEVPRFELVPRMSAVAEMGYTLFDFFEPCYYDSAFWQADACFIRNDVFREKFLNINQNFVPEKFEIFRG